MTGMGKLNRRAWLRAVAGGLAIATLSVGADRAARAEDLSVAVNIDNFAFAPATVTIKPGTVVTWTNRDDIPHVVVIPSLKQRSKVMDTDQTFNQRFDTVGKFSYFCGLHPHMKGEIIVK